MTPKKQEIPEEDLDAYCEANGFERTGVVLTDEEFARLAGAYIVAKDTPVIKVRGVWLPDAVLESANEMCNELAEKHGLPKLPDVDGEPQCYGLMANGELNRVKQEEK